MKTPLFINQTRIWISDLTVGGSWGRTLEKAQQFSLHWFWFDGFFASASDSIILNYVALYVIALGATETQVGLMSSFSSIACALVLLPGALLAEHAQLKKRIALLFYTLARFWILLLVFVPILFKGPMVIWIAIALSVARDASTNLAWPAWMDVTNVTVPIEGRGRYFGSRNFVMGVTGMITTLGAGQLITMFVAPLGYQIALASAFVLGMASTFSYSHIQEPLDNSEKNQSRSFSFKDLKSMIKDHPQFLSLTITAAVWNFAMNISGPFFNVQMVETLKFTTATIGFLSVVSSFTSMITQHRIGALSDRIGPHRLQLISMFLIPLLPLAWIFARNAWEIAIINLFNGVFWGIFNLAYFNLLLEIIPRDQVSRYSAVYQIVVMLTLALGALVGSAIVPFWGFTGVCIGSAIFRYAAAGLFAKIVRDPRKELFQSAES